MSFTRRRFLTSAAVSAAVAAARPSSVMNGPRLRVEVEVRGPADDAPSWCPLPDGLVEVRAGQAFRMTNPVDGRLVLQAVAIEDGGATTDADGLRIGQVAYDLDTAVEG